MSPTTFSRRPSLPFFIFLLAASVLFGCSGDGNDGGGGGPTGPQPFVVLTPDTDDAPSVTLARGAATEGANLVLEIQANELKNVRTLDFILTYPGNLMRATAVDTGDFLGINASVITTALDQNRLQVLMTRISGSGATGSGLVLSVRFEGIGNGTGRIEFVAPEAADPTGIAISGIKWLGGDVEVSP